MGAHLLVVSSTWAILAAGAGHTAGAHAGQEPPQEASGGGSAGVAASTDTEATSPELKTFAEGEGSGEGALQSPDLKTPFGEQGDGSPDLRDPLPPPLSKRKDRKWIKRWAPENNTGEIGVFLGVLGPSTATELFRPDRSEIDQGQKELRLAPDFGVRFGYYPLRFLGIEAEAAVMPTSAADDSGSATLWGVRGHAVGQLGLWSVTPFVLVGGGLLAVSSGDQVVGNDIDQAFHVGGGLKFYLNRWAMLRVDVRDILTPRVGLNSGPSNNIEALLGFSITLGRWKDRDVAEQVAPEPTPTGPSDRDGDGFADDVDKCPDEPGVAPDGCPLTDRDGDGFTDDVDQCPDEPGVDPDGCPNMDPDNDGILGAEDACPDVPETVNGFSDADGCPDELPEEIQRFEGTIEGIYFDVNKAVIKSASKRVLDEAAEILNKYPTVRVEISGHTDSTGSREHNMDLSRRRAEAVRDYLQGRGLDSARMETRGGGPDEPIDSNATRGGRAKNRRIEFRILR